MYQQGSFAFPASLSKLSRFRVFTNSCNAMEITSVLV